MRRSLRRWVGSPGRSVGQPGRRPWLYWLLLLLGSQARPAAAQLAVSGTVRDSLTRQPLPFASVFLANTTYGTTTDAQGHFQLAGLPKGAYALTASYLGYALRQRPVVLAGESLAVELLLPAASQALAEVVVRPHPHHAEDYARFLELFLGTSTRAQQCRVRNPAVIQLDYDPEQNVLMATITAPLEIDNVALGYRLTCYDLNFRADFRMHTTSSLSQLAFRPLPAGAAHQRRWAAARQRAYRGSLMHFLRAVVTNTVASEGFEVQRLRRVVNQRRAVADSIWQTILAGTKPGAQALMPDSIQRRRREPAQYAYLFTPLLDPLSYRATRGGRTWLRFADLLAITYPSGQPDANYQELALTLTPGRELTAVLHVTTPPEAELEASGVPRQPAALLGEGYWGFLQLADLLPLDYQPVLIP
jgi:hypothetical protein